MEKRQKILAFFLLAVGAVGFASRAAGVTIYLAPDGSDNWSGRLAQPNVARTDGPVATLEQARDLLRRQKNDAGLKELARVVVAGGTYALTAPFTLTPQDSGTQQFGITYEAAPGAKPVFTGGKAITGFEPDTDGIWKARLPEVASGQWYVEQLFVNGRRAVRARSPNKFYDYMLDVQEEILAKGSGQRAVRARQTVTVRPEDLKPLLSLGERELHDVQMVIYHKWDNTIRFIESVNAQDSTIVTTGEGRKPWNAWSKGDRYHLENFKAALDAPGEWFLSRDGWLYYKPLAGEDMRTAEVVAPVIEKLLICAGDVPNANYVESITIKGLTFLHAEYHMPPGGFEASQAAAPIDAAVMADGTRNVVFQDCEFGHIGRYGVWFRKGCQNCTLQGCYVHDFGAGAVRIGEASVPRTEPEQTGHITLDNNILRSGGRIFPCAVGVWIGHSADNAVTHNEIADMYYTGISAGWVWGYSNSIAKRNNISFNHVHHLGWAVLSDMGGIYTLGSSEGTVVSNNVFHDIYAYSYGGWGLYTDEGSTGIAMEKNLVYNTKTGSFHQHYGKENIIRNNIFVNSLVQQVQATRVEQHLSFTFEKNIIYWATGPLLSGPWTKLTINMDNNCYWNTASKPISFAGLTLDQWRQQQRHDEHSIIADPLFVDPQHNDFHLKPDSPALKVGFEPFDYTKAGVYGAPAWITKANEVTYPPLEWPPEAPPLAIKDDFEKTAVGQRPQNAEVNVENRGDSIAVTDETAAGSKHSLKIVDAPGLKNVWDPHLVYSPNHSTGTTRCAFDLRIEQGVSLNHEWRDWRNSPYGVGPSFSIVGDAVQTAGKTLLHLPLSQWIHFEVTAGLSQKSAGTWSLIVTLPGESPKAFQNLKNGSSSFERLTWLGFTSNAIDKAVFYLDNLEITNQP
jgi:hypothetical protein